MGHSIVDRKDSLLRKTDDHVVDSEKCVVAESRAREIAHAETHEEAKDRPGNGVPGRSDGGWNGDVLSVTYL